MTAREQIAILRDQMNQSVIGQNHVVERILTTLLADGNLLLEGMPGLAKTRAIKSLSKNLEVDLSRIQFTPDLLPSDVTGTEVYQPDAEESFIFKQGPIFSNLVLADEINRAPAKVQAALLEAMEERQVTVAGKSYKLPPLFMVMATQNPIEQEGTYPLPEAQMDRFIMHVIVDYPDKDSEVEVLRLVRGESKGGTKPGSGEKIGQDAVMNAREEISNVRIAESVERYIVDIIDGTRNPGKYSKELDGWLDYGASPRGGIALDKCSRVMAWLDERDYVTPEDVQVVVHDCLRHRIVPSYEANAEGVGKNMILDELLKLVATS